jgi:histone H3/H4
LITLLFVACCFSSYFDWKLLLLIALCRFIWKKNIERSNVNLDRALSLYLLSIKRCSWSRFVASFDDKLTIYSTRALREIQKIHKSATLLILSILFSRLLRKIIMNNSNTMQRVQISTFNAMQEIIETYIIFLLKNNNISHFFYSSFDEFFNSFFNEFLLFFFFWSLILSSHFINFFSYQYAAEWVGSGRVLTVDTRPDDRIEFSSGWVESELSRDESFSGQTQILVSIFCHVKFDVATYLYLDDLSLFRRSISILPSSISHPITSHRSLHRSSSSITSSIILIDHLIDHSHRSPHRSLLLIILIDHSHRSPHRSFLSIIYHLYRSSLSITSIDHLYRSPLSIISIDHLYRSSLSITLIDHRVITL